uniref:Aminopeptidase n=2 Tax=Hirondellea gigas TaxID=1518452 RepID=A0A6A7FVH9_9CRUS
MSTASHLLPTTVLPSHYEIKLSIDLEKLCFSGDEAIQLQVKTPVQEITLHSIDLAVSKVSVCQGEKCIIATEVQHNTSSQSIIVKLAEELSVGAAVLYLSFAADLNTKMRGLYKSKYTGCDGGEHWMAVTQFEAASARRCFPCWDEPLHKATFSLTLTVPADRTTLSNMPEEKSEADSSDSSRRVVKFKKTPIMSTYLVAVVVGEYEHVEKTLKSGVLVRVFTPKGRSTEGEFALDVACRSLDYYEDYFQIAYPLSKMDLITVPDFSAGAMENWGLVTYRETFLLVDTVNSSAQHMQRVVQAVTHELAHQWFGNLVTMQWWTHLWLNEGYATFIENLCANHLFPEYQIWTQFLSHFFIPALELDCLDNTHPVEVEVYSSNDVDQIFDEISYSKGASVIRMLHRYLGEDTFRRGMTLYLQRHQYSNTCTEDLWRALAETSQKPVEKVMSAWTRLSGFPMVSVEAVQKDDSTVLSLSQSRFFLNGKKDSSNTLWAVPIDIVCSMNDKSYSVLLEDFSTTIVLPKLPENGWIKVNSGACGYYRTKYSEDLLRRLIPLVKSRSLSTIDRINILDDLLAMVKAGHSSTVQLLELVQGYKAEEDYSVFICLRNCLVTLVSLFNHENELKGSLSGIICELFADIHSKLGWQPNLGESYMDRLLRPLVIIMLGENGYSPVVEKCKKDFAAHCLGTEIIPADLRACVYKTCMITGDYATLNDLIHVYKNAVAQEERDRASRCMAATENLDLLTKVFDFTMSEIRAQDIPFVLNFAALNSAAGSRFLWEYFKANHAKFVEMYEDSDLMIRLVKFVSCNFATEADADEVDSFFSKLSAEPVPRGVQQNIETIRLNAAWLARDADAVKDYLNKLQ